MATQAQITAVQQLYVSYLGRAADKAGLDFWSNAIANGTSTIESVATGLTLANEYTAAYGNLTTDALVDAVYTNVLGRAADAEGKAFWVAAFANGTVQADTFVSSLIQSLGAQDQATINNKTFVAQTYTDTVGDAYTPAGGAQVLVGVDSTAASVNTALAAIAGGTLPGQVPALSLVNSLATAQDALAAYGKTAAASNPTFDTTKDGKVDATEAADALQAANAARFGDAGATTPIVGVSTKTTAQLNADVIDTAAAAAASKAALNAATGGSVALAAYDKAVADYTAATAAVTAHEAAANAATAGLETSLTATGATVSYATISALVPGTTFTSVDGVGGIIEFLTNTTNAVQRANVVNELNKVANFGPETVKTADLAKAVVTTDAALNASVTGATDKLLAIDIGAATGVQSTDYVTTGKAATDAAALLTKAQTADAAIAAAKAVTDQYASLTKGVADANTALTQFEAANTAKVDLHNVSAADYATSAKADVFYFAAKATAITGAIADFGTGDSIVLGSAYTQGTSLAAGDSNKVEFFLVQGSTGVQVIAETNAFGNSTTTTDASGNVLAHNDAAVITLTGVALADLTVSNGVISHVA